MNRLMINKFLASALLLTGLVISEQSAGASGNLIPGSGEMPQLFRKGEPKAAVKAKKKQEAKEKKKKKDYAEYVKGNQKRSIEIQTPEVQERMKQNVKDANSKYKARKKSNANRTKKAGRKYNS